MILVVGATGLLGTRVCERLRAEGQPVRALVRRTSNPDNVNALRSLGCELATGDLKDPPQIQAACQGISALISTASSTLSRQPGDSIESVDLHGQLGLANAARSAGVRRFIYVSFRDDRTVQYHRHWTNSFQAYALPRNPTAGIMPEPLAYVLEQILR
jgi:uncharacterized protein YbjT (DUF2867 family)